MKPFSPGIAAMARRKHNWKYTLSAPAVFDFPMPVPGVFENKWMKLTPDGLTVFDPYSWDGSTGVPDGPVNPDTGFPNTYYPSCGHDAWYQFAEDIARHYGWTVYQVLTIADQMFMKTMIRDNVEWWRRRLYYRGVRVLGYAFHQSVRLLHFKPIMI